VAQGVREFFEGLEGRADPAKIRGVNKTYRFDIDGAGSWVVRVADGAVKVNEGDGEADVTFSTSEETFRKIVSRDQNPMMAYMSGKLRIHGDVGAAMQLKNLF
jgi:putative sterol carrier protein